LWVRFPLRAPYFEDGKVSIDIKSLVKGTKARFIFYRDKNLWYEIVDGPEFEFPVPIEDVGNGTFLREDKAIMLMRYIRKHLEVIENQTT